MKTKRIFKLCTVLVLSLAIYLNFTTPVSADWVSFTNQSSISSTAIKVNSTINLTSYSTGGYSTTGMSQGKISDDIKRVKYVWTITNQNNKQVYSTTHTIAIGAKKTVTTPKLERGNYVVKCTAYSIAESGATMWIKSVSYNLKSGGYDWVAFKSEPSLSATKIKSNNSVTLTVKSSGGYSRTGEMLGKVSDDVVNVRYTVELTDAYTYKRLFYGEFTISRTATKKITTSKLSTGTYVFKCKAVPITRSGEELPGETRYLSVQVGGNSWDAYKNESSVSAVHLKANTSVNLIAKSSGGYSPTGFFQGKVSDDIAKVRYVWVVVDTENMKNVYRKEFTTSRTSITSVTTPKLSPGVYMIHCYAYPITISGKQAGSYLKSFKIEVSIKK